MVTPRHAGTSLHHTVAAQAWRGGVAQRPPPTPTSTAASIRHKHAIAHLSPQTRWQTGSSRWWRRTCAAARRASQVRQPMLLAAAHSGAKLDPRMRPARRASNLCSTADCTGRAGKLGTHAHLATISPRCTSRCSTQLSADLASSAMPPPLLAALPPAAAAAACAAAGSSAASRPHAATPASTRGCSRRAASAWRPVG